MSSVGDTGLKWYRSWPSENDWANLKAKGYNFAYVQDAMPKIIMSGQNYKSVTDFGDWPEDLPGFCMLEWDIALSPYDRMRFAGEALSDPYKILVAPYLISTTNVHRFLADGRPIQDKQSWCETFGLGCIYIPQKILREFLAQMDHHGFSDGEFSRWVFKNYGRTKVTWKVQPQHLHEYELE